VSDTAEALRAVRRSHDELAALAGRLEASDLVRPSYCSEWSIAQVFSHLGSQADIFSLFVAAGLGDGDAPDQSVFPPIWDAWNARSPEAQVADSVAANEQFVTHLEGLGEERLAGFRLQLYGMDLDATRLLLMRLAEHALHSWDVAVALDPAARVAPDSVEQLVDGVTQIASRAGKPAERSATIAITTSDPERQFVLVTDGVSLEPGTAADPSGSLDLPAEGLLRLVYGRLDAALPAAEPMSADGITLDELRAIFPGV